MIIKNKCGYELLEYIPCDEQEIKQYKNVTGAGKDNEKIVGLIVGLINNDETERYDFKAPKRGRITELIVDKEYRGKQIGKQLLDAMKEYLKSIECEKNLLFYNFLNFNEFKKQGRKIAIFSIMIDFYIN